MTDNKGSLERKNDMKVTKYPQSCLMFEQSDKCFLIDPGSLKYQSRFLDEWRKADAIFITHKHQDHINIDVLKDINLPIYATNEVQKTYPDIKFNIVKEGEKINFGEVSIEVVKAIHGYNPLLKGAGEVLENVGYIIDNGKNRLYITSDTICFNNDYKADVVALPVTSHGLTMSAFEAALFSKELGATLVLPIHMDNEKYPTDVEYMKSVFEKFDINYQVLDIDDTIDIL